jgi:hypothetical protein
MRGYKALSFTKCTTIMIVEVTVMSGLGSSQDYIVWVWFGTEWFDMVFGVAYVEPCDP